MSTITETTTIRVSAQTHQMAQLMSREAGISMQQIIERALEQYRRTQILEATCAGYAALRADPVAWAEEQAERAVWDGTLMDGLEEY